VRYLVDTNVSLRWSDKNHPCHAECVDAVDRIIALGGVPYTCAQVLIEHWAVATRPISVNGFGMESETARSHIAQLRQVFVHLPEPPDIADLWLDIVTENHVMGKQAHDARLVALMLAHGVTNLLTLNPSDFTRYQRIRAVTPRDILCQNAI
jgi:predicted nucleic acid-binding protein